MTPDVMSHIFDPLYTTKDRGRGTGLGLVIVKQIVTEFGGAVDVESEVGNGTSFRLSFPAIPSDLPLVLEPTEQEMELGVRMEFR
jgi:signal transduction histidine kinase